LQKPPGEAKGRMKRIFSSENSAELGSLQNMLGAAGIQCVIRENPDPAVPSFLKLELWVGHDADYAKARGLCTRWRHPSPDRPSYWTCSACGAGSEDRFNACWKCGAQRDAAS
jgi:hypothetical protein